MESIIIGGKLTDSNYTHLMVVLDRSGSMMSIQKDMEGGLNSLFEEQAKLPGKCLVDFAQFDNDYDLVYTDTPVAEAKAVLTPRGSTSLLDALGKTITTFGEKLDDLDESDRPGKVLVIVVTDGQENSSTEWSRSAVKELVERQERDYNWNFVFLGANMDAVAEGATFGTQAGSSLTYTPGNVNSTTRSLSNYVSNYRIAGSASFSDEDRKAAAGS